MSRAPRLSPDERRSALIEATVPLLLQHGSAVSTRQIAEAAGVAEGTIFRVFDSKEDLLHACATQVLASGTLAPALAALPPDLDLHGTVTRIARALAERLTDVHAMIAILHEQGRGRRGPGPVAPPGTPAAGPHGPRTAPEASPTCERPDPRAIHDRVIGLVTGALTPHADALRTSPRMAASALVALAFGAHHDGPAAGLSPTDIADVLLHGVGAPSSQPSQGA